MSELARKLLLGATLAALSLVGATAAQATDPSTSNHTSLAPTEGRVGETWHKRRAPAEEPSLAGDARRDPSRTRSVRPGILGPASRCSLSNQAGSQTGSEAPWEC
jgi:hypothetical protein